MDNRKMLAARARAVVAEAHARDEGRDYFRMQPTALLVAVARIGAERFPDSVMQQIAFIEGYTERRREADAFQRGE